MSNYHPNLKITSPSQFSLTRRPSLNPIPIPFLDQQIHALSHSLHTAMVACMTNAFYYICGRHAKGTGSLHMTSVVGMTNELSYICGLHHN